MRRNWIFRNILLLVLGWISFLTHALVVPRQRSMKTELDAWANEMENNKNVHSRANSDNEFSENKILNMLMENYDKRIRPPPNNSTIKGTLDPVLVKVNILIRMLSKIDVVNMEYSMQITFRERWQDRRLAFDHLNFANQPKFLTVPHIKSSIWLPDTFFPTEKAAHRHMIDTENMFLRIYGNGTILYSARLSLTCSCPMHLQLYPLDVQHCDFDLISYAHTTRDILYEWDVEPVQLKPGVGEDLPNFLLEKENIDTGVECASHTNTGTYACLRMRMRLSRLMTYFVLQLYFPTTMIVIVSWVSFWIDMHSTAGRVALAMTTLLTITTMQSSINAKLPPVNYVKVIDVWLGTCQTFVFGALIEYAIVCYRDNKVRSEKNRQSAAALRKSQSARARYKNPTAAALTPTTRQLMADKNVQKISMDDSDYYVDNSAPCTCSLGGIGSAMLAGFGFLEPALTTLIPMSIEYPPAEGENDVNPCNNGPNHYGETFPVDELKFEPNYAYSSCDRRHFSFRFRMPFLSQSVIWRTIKRKLKKPDYLPARIDYYARILMPLGFLIFNAFYWGICLYMSSQQKIK